MSKVCLNIAFIFLIIFNLAGCKKDGDEIKPANKDQDEDASITAMVGQNAFNGMGATESYKKAFTLTSTDGTKTITIGTDFPPAEGTYQLGVRDPFSGKNYYATYVNEQNIEYRTRDNTGKIEIIKVRVEGNDVKEIRAKFSFKAYSPTEDEIDVSDGVINYSE
jgi:hypothetical protein